LSGRVTEANTGEVLIGANVVIQEDSLNNSIPLRGAATNKYGFYSIPNIPVGQYYIFVSIMGFETYRMKIVIKDSSSSLKVNFQLEKTTLTLNEVIIQDRRKTDFTTTTSTIQVEPELIKKLPSMGGEADLFRALQLLPGVTAETEISTGIYVRGGSPDQNLTLVDGVVVYNPSHLGGFSSTFNSEALQNIKLIKGGFPAEYGGRLSSILDVTMREGNKEKFLGSAGISVIGARLTLEGPLSKNSTYILSGRKMFLDKILQLIPKTGSIPRYNFFDMNGKVNYIISDENRIFISGFYSQDNLGEAPNNKDVGFDISWKNVTVNLSWINISSSILFSNTSLMFTNYNFSTLIKDKLPVKNPYDFFTSSDINDIIIKRDMQIFVDETHTIKTGIELTYHLFSTTTSDYFIKELKYKPTFGKKTRALESAIYAQDDWQISEDVKINFGGRLYYFQNSKFLKFEPRISVTYYLLDRFIIRSAFAVAHQPLHMLVRNDVYLPTDVWYPSTTVIEPSRSIQGSVCFEATSFDRSFLFSLEGYYKDMSNLYEYKLNADFSYGGDFEKQLTQGRGEAYGFELFLNKRIGIFTGWIGYTLAYTKRYFEELNRGIAFHPRFDRRHDITCVVTVQPIKNLSIGATWIYGTGQAYSLPVGQYSFTGLTNPQNNNTLTYYEYSSRDAFRLPPFHKLDINFKYEIEFVEQSLEFSVSIYNVYNRFNVFSKYIGYKIDPITKDEIPVLKQFTLFPILPTVGVNYKF
jgi:outer membrane receptor protein involved in Fe transport